MQGELQRGSLIARPASLSDDHSGVEAVSLEFGLPSVCELNAWRMYEWQDEARTARGAAAMSAPAVRSSRCRREQKDSALRQLDPLG